ncbi:hypothetical protein [Treponema endosymbiont of Eucomonympha sp.]|uniref:hypothetical protein n=1 Tax=Treponema endosymbiont of Eucomonympha sp. TaxID=1580831 RepID=UPI000780DEFB|nr:hypothetical protein [Treponema endosymbiont of Eucomonympha sp.]
MTEDRLTELDKVFMKAFLTTWKAEEQELGRNYLLSDLDKHGHVVKIESREVGDKTWTVFRFSNKSAAMFYPRMSKFRDAYAPTCVKVK